MTSHTLDANAEAQALITATGRANALSFANAMANNALYNPREADPARAAFWVDVATLIRLETADDEPARNDFGAVPNGRGFWVSENPASPGFGWPRDEQD